MAHTYTPVDTFHAEITVPDDGDVATGPGLTALEYLADNTKNLSGRADDVDDLIQDLLDEQNAHKNEANTFVEPQTIALDDTESNPALTLEVPKADTPLLATTTDAGSHPGNASNKWKLLGRFKRAGGTYAYIYSGADTAAVGGFAIVVNAYWDVDEQKWVQESTGSASSALVWRFDKLVMWRKPSGSSTHWTNAEWEGGRLDGLEVIVTGDLSGGNDVKATQNMRVTNGEYLYTTPWERETLIDANSAIPRLASPGDPSPPWTPNTSGSFGWISTAADAIIEQPFRLPHGSTLIRIDVYHFQGLTVQDEMKLRIMNPVDWEDPDAGFDVDDVAGEGTFAGAGARITAINVNQEIDNARSYAVVFTAGLADVRFMAMRLIWSDPGPRNY